MNISNHYALQIQIVVYHADIYEINTTDKLQ